MLYLSAMIRIKLTKISNTQVLDSYNFANESAKSSQANYKQRNQSNLSKIKNDIFLGKVAEYSIYNYYVSKGFKITAPDIQIYQAKNKSFDADLTIIDKNQNIHVKSHFIKSPFPPSWVFQKTDPLVTNPSPEDIIIMSIINVIGEGDAIIEYACNLKDKYKPLLKESLQSKTAIYLKDL